MNAHSIVRRTLLGACTGLIVATTLGQAVAAPAAGAQTMAIVTDPVGSERLAQLAPMFDSWRKAGLISTAKLLKAEPGQKEAGFSTLALIAFPSEKAFKSWQAQALPKLTGATVRQADLVKHDGMPSRDATKAVHVASFYATKVSAAAYAQYTDQYIAPNMDHQRAAGIMSQYTMLLERDAAGAKGRSLLVMEYAHPAAYAKREEVKSQGKAGLMANADWKRINDSKESFRSDLSSTAATELRAAAF